MKTKRVCITGTESTGKTILAEQLTKLLACPLVNDLSRSFIAELNRPYRKEDVLIIAQNIIDNEAQQQYSDLPYFISDNDLINIKIWLQYYQWQVPDWLNKAIKETQHDLFILCDIDLPWQADDQRQNPHNRKELFNQFKTELNHLNANFIIVNGMDDERTTKAIEFVGAFFKVN